MMQNWDEAPTRIRALCDGRVDGLVVVAPRLEDDGQPWLPRHTLMVSVHASRDWRVGGVNLESDDEAGALEMVRQMLALGHRPILHVGGPLGYPGADQRVEGYDRAHAEAGVTPAQTVEVLLQLIEATRQDAPCGGRPILCCPPRWSPAALWPNPGAYRS